MQETEEVTSEPRAIQISAEGLCVDEGHLAHGYSILERNKGMFLILVVGI